MKMNFTVLVGGFVVLMGVSILAQALFNVQLPLMRTAVALFFLFIGFKLLVSAWTPEKLRREGTATAVMTEQRFAPTTSAPELKYDVLFSKGLVDLTQMPKPDKPIAVEVNSVFSSTEVLVDPTWPVVVEGSSAFGEVRMPNRSAATFGAASYRTTASTDAQPLLRLKVNAVFGNCLVLEQRGGTPPEMQPLHP